MQLGNLQNKDRAIFMQEKLPMNDYVLRRPENKCDEHATPNETIYNAGISSSHLTVVATFFDVGIQVVCEKTLQHQCLHINGSHWQPGFFTDFNKDIQSVQCSEGHFILKKVVAYMRDVKSPSGFSYQDQFLLLQQGGFE